MRKNPHRMTENDLSKAFSLSVHLLHKRRTVLIGTAFTINSHLLIQMPLPGPSR